MRQRRFGELQVSAIGGTSMSEYYGGRDEPEAIATIHRALDSGITLLDTPDTYVVGTNEGLLGRAISDRRDEVVLAAKFGNVRKPSGEFVRIAAQQMPTPGL